MTRQRHFSVAARHRHRTAIKILVEELWINPLEATKARLAVVRSAAAPARESQDLSAPPG
jgi:hypothetical protein